MKTKFSILSSFFLLALVVFLSTGFDGCGGDKKLGAPSVPVVITQGTPQIAANVTRRTLLGLKLTSEKEIPADVDAVADASFSRLLADSRSAGYSQNLDANLYTIKVKQDCIPSPESGTLSFKVRADDYNGTPGDINPDPVIGEVYAAEQVETVYNPKTKVTTPLKSFTICYADAATMTNTVRAGGEHPILYDNERAKYEATVNHGTSGSIHPLIAKGN